MDYSKTSARQLISWMSSKQKNEMEKVAIAAELQRRKKLPAKFAHYVTPAEGSEESDSEVANEGEVKKTPKKKAAKTPKPKKGEEGYVAPKSRKGMVYKPNGEYEHDPGTWVSFTGHMKTGLEGEAANLSGVITAHTKNKRGRYFYKIKVFREEGNIKSGKTFTKRVTAVEKIDAPKWYAEAKKKHEEEKAEAARKRMQKAKAAKEAKAGQKSEA